MKINLIMLLFLPDLAYSQNVVQNYPVTNSILSYYLSQYSLGGGFRIVFEETADDYQLSSYSPGNEYSEYEEPNETITIPKSHRLIKGDINGDLKDDFVVSVMTGYGASGFDYTIFIYLSSPGGLQFYKMYNASDLAFCQQQGAYASYFIPTQIKNSVLYGTSECFLADDVRCCPSLRYSTEFIFNNGLIFRKQELIK